MNQKQPEVIGIASGKGGVGKTTISVNLAIALSNAGKKVFLFDADLGLANAQIALGMRTEYNFSHVVAGEKKLNDILLKHHSGVTLIPGASGVQQMAALGQLETAAVVQAFSELKDEIDYLIIDMAAGISPSVLTLMQACHRKFVVVIDEPSSIADAYGVIKVMLQAGQSQEIYLIENRVENPASGLQLFNRINDVCIKFLDHSIFDLGSINKDESIVESLRSRKSIFEHAMGSSAAMGFKSLAENITELKPVEKSDGGLEFFVERRA
ncbi:MAG: chromosome partitioning ATPase [Betaproteobacteria bacterium TMED156]|nr:MAG: chromosome partitioning ATPase [Betaproteobacteria bacterium TMED156]